MLNHCKIKLDNGDAIIVDELLPYIKDSIQDKTELCISKGNELDKKFVLYYCPDYETMDKWDITFGDMSGFITKSRGIIPNSPVYHGVNVKKDCKLYPFDKTEFIYNKDKKIYCFGLSLIAADNVFSISTCLFCEAWYEPNDQNIWSSYVYKDFEKHKSEFCTGDSPLCKPTYTIHPITGEKFFVCVGYDGSAYKWNIDTQNPRYFDHCDHMTCIKWPF
jgi:hypothetical protein